jgi:FkbM family methyltransferase
MKDQLIQFSTNQGFKIFLPENRMPYQQSALEKYGSYEIETEKILEKFVKPGMNVVECGACCGYHALNLAKAVGDTGRVYCFEANSELMDILSSNIEINGFSDRTETINKGIWIKKDVLLLPIQKSGCDGARFGYNSEQSKNIKQVIKHKLKGAMKNELAYLALRPILRKLQPSLSDILRVEVVSIDEYFFDTKIDFLRMDIEGAELPALKGARNLLQNNQDLTIVLEWTPENTSEAESLELFDFLSLYNFNLYRIIQGGPFKIDKREDFHAKHTEECIAGQRDVLCTKYQI